MGGTSVVSAQSAGSRASSGGPSARPGQSDDLMDTETTWIGNMHGAIYTVCQEKTTHSWPYIIVRLVLHWLQLWLLVVQAPQFDIDTSLLGWRILSFVSIKQFMSARGYTFFLACFYLLVVGIALTVAAGAYLAYTFQTNTWPPWLPKLVRLFSRTFYQTLDIFLITLLLIPLDCQMFASEDAVTNYNKEFPEVACFVMPHLIHVFVAVLMIPVAVIMAGLFAVGEMELDLTSDNPMAFTNAELEVTTLMARFAMACVATLIYNPKWASVVIMCTCFWLAFMWWRWQPHMAGWPNHVRTGIYLSVAWCSWLYVVSAFSLGWDGSNQAEASKSVKQLTKAMWVTTIPIGMLGYLLSWLRQRWFRNTVLREFRQQDIEHGSDYQFEDGRLVELVARICRKRLGDLPNLDPTNVRLAATVMTVGASQLPKDPFMVILHAAFLINVQGLQQQGYHLLDSAGRLDLGFMMRLAVFTLQQQKTRRSAKVPGTRAADLVNYVEFQRNYQLALKCHKEVLTHMKSAWELLLHDTVQMRNMERCTAKMAAAIAQADSVYRAIMQRHGTNVKLVRLWAKYLEHVKLDPWGRSSVVHADRLEALQENEKAQSTMENWETEDPTLKDALAAGLLGHATAAGDARGAIIMNAQSQIQMANQVACDILGYTRAEIRYKDIKLILPPQIQDIHPTFIANYLTTGKTNILNQTMQQVALHKDRRLVPVMVCVMKIRGVGEDTLFLGVLTSIPMEPDEATVWVTSTGNVMGVCENYQDWFGFPPKDVAHKPMASLATKGSKQIDEALRRARMVMLSGPRPVTPPPLPPPKKKGYGSISKAPEPVAQAAAATAPAFKDRRAYAQPAMTAVDAASRMFASAVAGPPRPVVQASVLEEPVPEEQEDEDMKSNEDESVFNITSHVAAAALPPFHIEEGNDTWRIKSVPMAHKYAADTVVDVSISNAGMASLQFHVVKLRRHWSAMNSPRSEAATPRSKKELAKAARGASNASMVRPRSLALNTTVVEQDLMIVLSSAGKVCHMTGAVAERLGRSRAKLATSMLSIDHLLMEPYSQIHRSLLQATTPASVPLYSCRSGVSVLLSAQGAQGRQSAVPFKLVIRKRQELDETFHVVHLTESTFDQAMDERRLLYDLDDHGIVKAHASTYAGAALFGFDPEVLVGRSILTFLDIMKTNDGKPISKAKPDDPSCSEAYQVLLELVSQAFQRPGVSWRVGVTPPTDLVNTTFKMNAAGSRTKSAIMRLTVSNSDPGSDLEGGVSIQMELWRAEATATVIHLDATGHILPLDVLEVAELFPSGLVLGQQFATMVDKHIGSFLPAMRRKPMTQLFVPGALGPPPNVGNAQQKRGGMKGTSKSVGSMGDARSGPQQTITVTHLTDGAPLQLCIQAVRKSGQSDAAFALIIRPLTPRGGRPDFAKWLLAGGVVEINGTNRRTSMLATGKGKVTMQLTHGGRLSSVRMSADFDPFAGGTDEHSTKSGNHFGGGNPTASGKFSSSDPRHSESFTRDPDGHETTAWGVNGAMRAGLAQIEENGMPPMPEDSPTALQRMSPSQEDQTAAMVAVDDDIAGDAEDEANTINDSDYKRGARYKRLYRMFASPLVQGPMEDYNLKAYIIFLCICAIQIGVFILMHSLLKEQTDLVHNLAQIGEAGKRASDIGLYARLLSFQYFKEFRANLPLMDGPQNIPYVRQLLKEAVDEFGRLHRGVYLGFGKQRRLPKVFGLCDLWEETNINTTAYCNVQFNQSLSNWTSMKLVPHYYNLSLWDTGNALVQKGNSVWQNINEYNRTQNYLPMFSQPDLKWIVHNLAHAIFPNYRATLDDYVRYVLAQMTQINTVQLVLLVVVGIGACLGLTIWTWILLKRMSYRRFSMYYILMAVPSGLVRRLATRRTQLDEEDEEGDNDDDLQDAQQATQTNRDAPLLQGDSGGQSSKMSLKSSQFNEGESWYTTLFPFLCKRRKHPAEMRSASSKKRLVPTHRATVLLLAPILVWGFLVVISNAVGYMLLNNSVNPVSLFNEVNYVALMYERNNFFLQEMMYETPAGMPAARTEAVFRIRQFEKDYKLMLYGAQMFPNETSFHWTSIKTGIAYKGGKANDILFNTNKCLALNASECQPETSILYQDTRTGLDRLVSKYIELGQYILKFTGKDPFITGPEYYFYWNTQADMAGGFTQLVEAYSSIVDANIGSVVTLHMIALLVTLALVIGCILFVLRPMMRVMTSEGKILALLLSQLPAEVDVGGLLKRTLLLDMAVPGTGNDDEKGGDEDDVRARPSMDSKREPLMGDDAPKQQPPMRKDAWA